MVTGRESLVNFIYPIALGGSTLWTEKVTIKPKMSQSSLLYLKMITVLELLILYIGLR